MKLDVSKLSYAEIVHCLARLPFAAEQISLSGGRVLLELERAPRVVAQAPMLAVGAMEFA